MGVVYRARDTRVGRSVAVKVLPSSFASDADRLRRFEQEARAAAALNHPNLLTVHDVGAIDGVPYIVSELLEGSTLREKLQGDDSLSSGRHSAIPTRKAIDWASSIAKGLAAAHDKGVIHRDLKPENIFVTTDGRVKILDFGLAKLTSSFLGSATDDTITQRNTSPGAIVGTVGYMSPEQVRGQHLDHRTDIFSLGAIIYEMLAGQRAFQGVSAADTMSAILRQDPPELEAVGVEISIGLERLVRRCLEKNRDERFHSAHDLGFALEAISGSPIRSAHDAAMPDRHRFVRPVMALAAALLIATAAFFVGRSSTNAAEAGADRTQPARFVQLTNLIGRESEPAISPDGASFIYSAPSEGSDDIFLQRVGGGNPINLTNSVDDEGFGAFSPHGDQIAFIGRGGLFVMGATGEAPRRLSAGRGRPAWAPDGRSIVVSTSSHLDPRVTDSFGELLRVDVSTGESTKIEVGGLDAVDPSCSPDGKWISFWGVRDESKRVICVVPAGGGVPNILTDDDFINWFPVWTPDSRAIVFSSTRGGSMNLWRLPVDPETGKPSGHPRPVTASPSWTGRFSIARTGAIAFESRAWTSTIQRAPIELQKARLGEPVIVMGQTTDVFDPDPSPDGLSLAVTIVDPDEDLVAFSIDDPSKRVRLTHDAFRDRGPRWLQSGERLLFHSDRSEAYECWSIRADGSGLRRETSGGFLFPDPSPDGVHFFAMKSTGDEWFLFDLRTPLESRLPVAFPEIEEDVSFRPLWWSSDGAKIIGEDFQFDELSNQLYAYTLATGTYEEIVHSGDRGAFLGMSPDEGSIVLVAFPSLLLLDPVRDVARTLGPLSPSSTFLRLARDAQTLYSITREHQSDIWLLEPEAK